MILPSPFIIAGPTAVGKSDVAAAVAEGCGGELVSADAFQIYDGLDILTAKPSADLRARVPHHLVGEIPLSQPFDVGQYLRRAADRIADIRARNRIPIVVGGTGLYLRALTHGVADLPRANASLREELENLSTGEILSRLAELDPISHAQIDHCNRRRVIRALEVCLLTNRPFSSYRAEWSSAIPATGIVLTCSREELHRRINQRTESMFAAGVVEEVRAADPLGSTASQTLGLRQIRALLDGAISQEECLREIQQATRRYAKRQLTWFRREDHLKGLDLGDSAPSAGQIEEIARRVRETFR